LKLFFSSASPFARKALVTFIECGLREAVELVPTNPHVSHPEFVQLNPFSKIPALQLDDGSVIIESYFICEYIDELAGGGVVLPQHGQARRMVLQKHMLGNGLMEASVLRRVESLRGKDPDREKNLQRQKMIMQRALDRLEAEANRLGNAPDLGNLCIATALDYLDFRFTVDEWRKGRPNLVRWHERFGVRPSLQLTMPSEASLG
jgi:glutathione S-transferase